MAKLLEEFPPVSTQEWEDALRADLQGADYEKKLVWRTAEGIAVKPFYRLEDLAGLEHLAAADGRTGNDWRIADQSPEISVDAGRFEEAGGTVVQELGYALAEGIEYVSERNPSEMTFSFAMGSSYFFQIAKLRAFRLVWKRVTEAFGANDLKLVIHCRTSRWNKSIYDAHVNIVRATTETMAAAIGGAGSITVEPFDAAFKESSKASQRLARNTQLILKHEAYLDKVADPAAGSYYIENLTDALARESWKLMQRIEERGGFRKVHDTGMISAELAGARAKRDAAVADRRRVFTGVNRYANPAERMLERIELHAGEGPGRGPATFEDIRLKMERSGRTPRFLLAEFGDVKMRKARSQFAADFFACAGFATETREFDELSEIASCQADAIVLCSSNTEYLAATEALKASGCATPIVIAGYPKDLIEALKNAGAADFVYAGSNAAATLAAWQKRLS